VIFSQYLETTLVISSIVVLEESSCPRGSSRTNFQVLVLVLGAQVLVLVLVIFSQYLETTLVISSVVVLEESPCPRGSSRTNFQVLVLVLGAQVLVLVLVLGSSSPRKFSRIELSNIACEISSTIVLHR